MGKQKKSSNQAYFHYTSLESFYSIVNSKELRFFGSKYMNDPEDCGMFI